jgi:hypothetical protein
MSNKILITRKKLYQFLWRNQKYWLIIDILNATENERKKLKNKRNK